MLDESTNLKLNSKLSICVMEEGRMHLALINKSSTVVIDKIEKSIPKKRNGFDKRDKALETFSESVANSIVEKVNWE